MLTFIVLRSDRGPFPHDSRCGPSKDRPAIRLDPSLRTCKPDRRAGIVSSRNNGDGYARRESPNAPRRHYSGDYSLGLCLALARLGDLYLRDCLGTLFRNSLTVGSLKKINNLFIKDIFHGYCLKRQSLNLASSLRHGVTTHSGRSWRGNLFTRCRCGT